MTMRVTKMGRTHVQDEWPKHQNHLIIITVLPYIRMMLMWHGGEQ